MAWFLMELPGLLVIAAVIQLSAAELRPILWLPWLLWSLHYGYRTFVFPAMMRTSGRTFPLLLVVFAWGFNMLNGYNNAQALLGNAAAGESPLSWPTTAGTSAVSRCIPRNAESFCRSFTDARPRVCFEPARQSL
jgi:hypothetical protein